MAKSRRQKKVKRFFQGGRSLRQQKVRQKRSERLAAVKAEEMEAGKEKRMKKYFKQALKDFRRKFIDLFILARPVEPSLFQTVNTRQGKLEVLKGRYHALEFLKPENWVSVKRIRTEHPSRGHRGSRFMENFEVVSVEPSTGREMHFVLKKQRFEKPELKKHFPVGEVEAAHRVRVEAMARFEEPFGYWTDLEGNKYAIFRKEEGRTMLFEKKEFGPHIYEAAQDYGRYFKAGISIRDTGTQHVFLTKKGHVFIDAEFFREEPVVGERANDFTKFMFDLVYDGNVTTEKQLRRTLSEFLKTAAEDKSEQKKLRLIFGHKLWLTLTRYLNKLEKGQVEPPFKQYSTQSKTYGAPHRKILDFMEHLSKSLYKGF